MLHISWIADLHLMLLNNCKMVYTTSRKNRAGMCIPQDVMIRGDDADALFGCLNAFLHLSDK
uniref:Uncharacterized protein n=1 Tax=Leersia perrieri TaxID=77586 RepID=A0A0D9V8E8_9ORYZ